MSVLPGSAPAGSWRPPFPSPVTTVPPDAPRTATAPDSPKASSGIGGIVRSASSATSSARLTSASSIVGGAAPLGSRRVPASAWSALNATKPTNADCACVVWPASALSSTSSTWFVAESFRLPVGKRASIWAWIAAGMIESSGGVGPLPPELEQAASAATSGTAIQRAGVRNPRMRLRGCERSIGRNARQRSRSVNLGNEGRPTQAKTLYEDATPVDVIRRSLDMIFSKGI